MKQKSLQSWEMEDTVVVARQREERRQGEILLFGGLTTAHKAKAGALSEMLT